MTNTKEISLKISTHIFGGKIYIGNSEIHDFDAYRDAQTWADAFDIAAELTADIGSDRDGAAIMDLDRFKLMAAESARQNLEAQIDNLDD